MNLKKRLTELAIAALLVWLIVGFVCDACNTVKTGVTHAPAERVTNEAVY